MPTQTSLSKIVKEYLITYFEAHEKALLNGNIHETVIKEVEKPLISLILKKVDGNQSEAARVLGLNRNTLRKKIRVLRISLSGKRS